jgi:hypothetical protein
LFPFPGVEIPPINPPVSETITDVATNVATNEKDPLNSLFQVDLDQDTPLAASDPPPFEEAYQSLFASDQFQQTSSPLEPSPEDSSIHNSATLSTTSLNLEAVAVESTAVEEVLFAGLVDPAIAPSPEITLDGVTASQSLEAALFSEPLSETIPEPFVATNVAPPIATISSPQTTTIIPDDVPQIGLLTDFLEQVVVEEEGEMVSEAASSLESLSRHENLLPNNGTPEVQPPLEVILEPQSLEKLNEDLQRFEEPPQEAFELVSQEIDFESPWNDSPSASLDYIDVEVIEDESP